MPQLLPCVEIEPRETADASVIWLHGLGADGHDFEPVVPMLGTQGVRYVFPHAPEQRVTINNGFMMPSWYDIRSLDFDADDREDAAQIEVSMQRVVALVQRERERGIDSRRIVLAGFSQGAAMAMHTAVRYGDPLAGLVALSGYLVLPAALASSRSSANLATPVLGCHGTYDDVVPVTAGRASQRALVASASPDAEHTWHEYPMGHEVCPEELQVIGAWLRARLPAIA